MYVVLSGKLSVYQHPIFGDNIPASAPVILINKPIRKQLGRLQSILGKWRCNGDLVTCVTSFTRTDCREYRRQQMVIETA